jgi:predicted RND superfamily exporter protein
MGTILSFGPYVAQRRSQGGGMERWYRFIIHRPRLVLFFIAVLTAFFAFHARHIRIDSSLDSLLPDNDPERQYYNDVVRLFGSENVAVVGILTDTIYTPQTLQKIQHLTDEFRKIPEVKNVFSLTNAPDIIAKITGAEQELLIPAIPTTVEEAASIKEKVATQPIYHKNLVSADGRAAAINIFFLESLTDNEFVRRGVDEKIQAIIDQAQGPEQLYYTGLPHFKAVSARTIVEDLSFLLPVALVLILVVLFFCLRSVRGVILPALTVIIGVTWTLGLMVLGGSHLSLGTLSLPPMLLVLGVAYSLHVVAEYYELAQPGRPKEEVLLETLRSMNTPVLMAALTTVLGFLSLFTNDIVSIREMGIYSAIGITIAFLLATILIPAALMLFPLPSRHQETYSPRLTAALRAFSQFIIRHRTAVILGSTVIAVLSMLPIPSIQVGSNFLSLFRESHPVRQATEVINHALVGSMAFYVTIDGSENDIMKKEDTLKRIKELQLYLNSMPGVNKTVSFVDYCELFDQGIQALPTEDGAPPPAPTTTATFWGNPAKLDEVMQLIFFNPTFISSVVNHPMYSRSNILVRTSFTHPREIADAVQKIQAFAKDHFPPEIKVHPTGTVILNTRTASSLVSGQIQSLALTAAVIFVIMTVMFLSFRVGIIAMIPNLLPILAFFGLMGVTGATLSIGTNTIAAIVLGLAVDDTIHIMSRLSAEARTTADQREALLRSLCTVGKPTLYYSLLVFLGFLSFGLSTFVPIQEFGLLSATTVAFGVLVELALLPALLTTTPVITLWDVLYVRLGQDPHKTIPLFAGLRPFQAKIVTLMGELKSFPKGHPIIRQGELGNEMYVVINGTADVFMHSAEQSRKLGSLERGDVFGEMGLIRHHERMADVVATQDVEVLAVNERFLERIKHRYPRIATEIFFNVSKILSDRLEQAQQRPR